MLTLAELKERLAADNDPDSLVELLNLSSEEILNAFEEKILARFDEFNEEYCDEVSEETEVQER